MTNQFEWQTALPESQGMSTSGLDSLRALLAGRGTKTFLIVRHDKIVYEWYAQGYGPTVPHYTASLAKALVGGISFMLALADGRLGVDDLACQYIPAWQDHPERSKITGRQLVTHSSGVENAEQDDLPHARLPGWKGAFWRRDPDPFSIARDQAPIIFPPGAHYAYSNPGMGMLAYAVTASLRGAPQTDIRSLLRERIMRPLGIEDQAWSVGYGQTYELDGLPLVANWGGGEFTARAVARVGRFMLRQGNWEGEQLVPAAWVDQCIQYAGTPLPDRPSGNPQPGSALGWWTNFDRVWDKLPRDAFAGAGAGNQILLVIPSLDLIVVRNGDTLGDEGFWGGLETYLFDPLMEAISGPPYAPSPVIQDVRFAPASTIVREAQGLPAGKRFDGSDNWPMTWGDDDRQYTAYGDGYGFAPYTDQKLSLGFSVVTGPPEDFQGLNVRSSTGERLGPGAHGAKASGMLMVGGVLFMWVRNMGNSQLAWSSDRGKSWTWSDWRFTTSFGCPTFLNFGRDYAGARDGYVYTYSPDANDAYTPADRLVLARVPLDGIRDRAQYQFFQRLDVSGKPAWTRDIDRRGGVFVFPGRCYRCGVSFNAGLDRYLLCQTLPGGDTRFRGGFGIYDAPEPWGPWSTAFFTREWDVGPGETSSFPTRWISPDGKTARLVFSGDDCFSVRRVSFIAVDAEERE